MKLASNFSDHMVLQRDQPIVVRGWADPGDSVTVRFAGQQKQTVAAEKTGKWQAYLDAMQACKIGQELTVESASSGKIIRLIDVLIGDVWLASGQSNMAWAVQLSENAKDELATSFQPQLRLFQVTKNAGTTDPEIKGRWEVSEPNSVSTFSAVAFFFGRELQRSIDSPIGLIHASWGGTRIETWMSREDLLADPDGAREVARCEQRPEDPVDMAGATLTAVPGSLRQTRYHVCERYRSRGNGLGSGKRLVHPQRVPYSR